MNDWTSKAVGLMHEHHITGGQLAEHMGVRREYISMILNGKRKPKSAESRVLQAIDEIIESKLKDDVANPN